MPLKHLINWTLNKILWRMLRYLYPRGEKIEEEIEEKEYINGSFVTRHVQGKSVLLLLSQASSSCQRLRSSPWQPYDAWSSQTRHSAGGIHSVMLHKSRTHTLTFKTPPPIQHMFHRCRWSAKKRDAAIMYHRDLAASTSSKTTPPLIQHNKYKKGYHIPGQF